MKKIPQVPYGFLKEVQNRIGIKVSRNYISMVRRGLRTNDAVLMAIIETEHNWKQIEYNKIKSLCQS
jgi:hypothetical protein